MIYSDRLTIIKILRNVAEAEGKCYLKSSLRKLRTINNIIVSDEIFRLTITEILRNMAEAEGKSNHKSILIISQF